MSNHSIVYNPNNLARDLRGWFNSSHVILFIGQNESDSDIKEYLTTLPWSCIITTRRDASFSSFFAGKDRTVKEYLKRDEIPINILNKKKLPVIRLLGLEDADNTDIDWLADPEEDSIDNAKELWKLVIDLMSKVNPLVITGFDSAKDWQVLGNKFILRLMRQATNGTISYWGMPSDVEPENLQAYKYTNQLAEEKHFSCYNVSLCEVIKCISSSEEELLDDSYSTQYSSDNDVFFCGSEGKSISSQDLQRFKNFGVLVTRRLINYIQPLGRDQQRRWFYNYLQYSASEGPQWYGYLDKSTYYVKRDYEETLFNIVKRELSGKGISDGYPDDLPIVLAGDPGSSKSVTLGSLAYRIFNEHTNPIIFIPNESFLNTNIGSEERELDDAMFYLEKEQGVNTRILVIWDSAAHRSDVSRVVRLVKWLQDRGRRFVLVCTSYNIRDYNDKVDTPFSFNADDGVFNKCEGADNPAVFLHNDCYFVKAERHMSEKEKALFWNTINSYSGINATTISALRKELSEQDEIFNHYYVLISLLREQLENSLKNEQSKVYPYVQRELKRILSRIEEENEAEKKLSPMYLAFQKAGVDVSTLFGENKSVEETDEDTEQRLDTFNLCVALFSRFKLVVPYSLAVSILTDGKESNPHSLELFQVVSCDIPWLYYGESEDGDFAFRFRNPLEADIYLNNHDANGEKQIEILRRVITLFGENFKHNQYIDLTFANNLQTLIRLMGPNTTYEPFKGESELKRNLQSKLGVIIDDLIRLSDEYGVPDTDAGFATIIVTFSREYYGKIWDKLYYPGSLSVFDTCKWADAPEYYNEEQYLLRIDRISKAIASAEDSYAKIESELRSSYLSQYERQHLINQMNVLTVEKALCCSTYQDLVEEFNDYCSDTQTTNAILHQKPPIPYQALYQDLFQVINYDPLNGYAYVAIFRAFLKTYEQTKDQRTRLQYMSEIMQVVVNCRNMGNDITSRGQDGRDEIGELIIEIIRKQDDFSFTLKDLVKHETDAVTGNTDEGLFWQVYDEMLESRNPAAITFVCQKEISHIQPNTKITDEDLAKCKAVCDFMLRQKNYDCISNNSYAMNLLIRTSWILFNQSVLAGKPECQLTHLSRKQWQQIHQYCQAYSNLKASNKQAIILLLYALSEVHVNHFDDHGFQEAQNIIDSIDMNTFHQQSRMRTPFMLCDESGNPLKYSGRVIKLDSPKTGFIAINEIPTFDAHNGIHFHVRNLGRNADLPEKHAVLTNLEIGMSFRGFNAYNEEGRHLKEEQD